MKYDQLELSKGNTIIPAYYMIFPKIKDARLRAVDYVVNLIDDNNDYQKSDD